MDLEGERRYVYFRIAPSLYKILVVVNSTVLNSI